MPTQIAHASFDEEDDVYLLTVALTKHGHVPKPKPPPEPKKPPPSPPVSKPPPPKPKMSTLGKAALAATKFTKKKEEPPKKPVEPPKPPVKKDAYIVKEEYQVDKYILLEHLAYSYCNINIIKYSVKCEDHRFQ